MAAVRSALACVSVLAACCAGGAAPAPGPGSGAPAPADGSPEAPYRLTAGTTVHGSTAGAPSSLGARCGAGAAGPEVVYAFDVDAPSRVRLELLTSDHDGALHVLREAGGELVEAACSEDAPDSRRSLVMTVLDAGTYLAAADGSCERDAGPYDLMLEVAPAAGLAGAASTCERAEPVDAASHGGEAVLLRSDTFAAPDDLSSTCASSPGGPDAFHTLTVPEDSLLTARVLRSDYPAVILALADGCAQEATACSISTLHARLSAGTHVLAVDSLGADLWGRVEISLRWRDLDALEARCDAAPLLAHGGSVSGATPATGLFDAGCGGGAPGPEVVHRLVLDEPSRVLLSLNSQGFDGVLHLRSRCTDPGSEEGCNDDRHDTRTSEIDEELPPGTWWVFADGVDPDGSGHFTLDVHVEPLPEGHTSPSTDPMSGGSGGDGNVSAPPGVPPPSVPGLDKPDAI